MNAFIQRWRDELILLGRVLMMLLFVISSWGKLTGFQSIVGYMGTVDAPMSMVAVAITVVMEFGAEIALLIDFWTRSLALLMALFVLGTALIAHAFWNAEGTMQTANMAQFYKNLNVMGRLLLLVMTGAGRYALQKSQYAGSAQRALHQHEYGKHAARRGKPAEELRVRQQRRLPINLGRKAC